MEDSLLFKEMRDAADALAGWQSLDYSVQSLDALDAALHSLSDTRPATHDAAAYLGEVLIRHGGFTWAWPSRYGTERGDEPAIRTHNVIGWVDVFAEIRRRTASNRHQAEDLLSLFARQVLTYSSSPSEETAERLGLKRRYTTRTNWDLVRWDYQRIRARLRRSGKHVRAAGS